MLPTSRADRLTAVQRDVNYDRPDQNHTIPRYLHQERTHRQGCSGVMSPMIGSRSPACNHRETLATDALLCSAMPGSPLVCFAAAIILSYANSPHSLLASTCVHFLWVQLDFQTKDFCYACSSTLYPCCWAEFQTRVASRPASLFFATFVRIFYHERSKHRMNIH